MYVPVTRHFVVDCEYSTTTNELISLAIVPLYTPGVDPSREFYEVIAPLPEGMSDWVQENVIPHLGKEGIAYEVFQKKLEAFLLENKVQMLHYDWCDDVAYINRVLITGPGERILFPHNFLAHVHHSGIEYASETAHNALEDARAIACAIRERILTKS